MFKGLLFIRDRYLTGRFLAALVTSSFIFCFGGFGFAEEKIVVFENKTSLPINELYLSMAGASDWRATLPAGQVVLAGQSFSARLVPDPAMNDVLLIFDDGSAKRYFGMDFGAYNRIKLKTDRAELIEDLEE